MTPKQWCRATGWPYDEWMNLTVPEVVEVLKPYGLQPPAVMIAIDKGYRAGWEEAFDAVFSVLGMKR